MSEFLNEAIQNQSVPLFFTVALFFAAISGFSLSVRHRVILVYSYCLLMNLLGVVDFVTVTVGSTVVLFLILEVFNPDSELVSLFSLRYKLLDFVYRLACELYGHFFYGLLLAQCVLQPQIEGSGVLQFLALFLIVALAAVTSRGRFSTKSVSEMRRAMEEAGGDPSCFEFSESDKGTIEMQILRNIGLEFGSFQLTLRRKVFEFVFSRSFFNSYIDQLERSSFGRSNVKWWILRCYLSIVPVKIGHSVCRPQKGSSTFAQVFGREFSELSREEFFVWCLGLPHYAAGVGPRAVWMHDDAVIRFGLDRGEIERVLERVR